MFDVNQKLTPMPSCAVTVLQIKKLFETLKLKSEEALSLETTIINNLTLPQSEKNSINNRFQQQYKPFVIFHTKHDGEILVRSDNPFESPLIAGKRLSGIQIKCDPILGGTLTPKLAYEVLFDFTTPSIFTWNNGVSDPTLNTSKYHVLGTHDTLVSSTLSNIESFLKDKILIRSWLHKGYIYDLGLCFITLPIGFLFSFSIVEKIKPYFIDMPPISLNLLYIYFFILVLFGYRLILGYTKWIWPKVENIDDSPSLKQRSIWAALIIGLLAGGIIEAIKLIESI